MRYVRLPAVLALVSACTAPEPEPAPIGVVELGDRADATSYQLIADGQGLRFANGTLSAHVDGDALVVTSRSAAVTVRARSVDGVSEPSAPVVGDCVPDGRIDLEGACLRRLALPREDSVEWWQNGPDGLEHGFTLNRVRGSEVRIEVAFEGATRVVTDAVGAAVTVSGETWRYDHLVASDASGRELDATMEAIADGVALVVDTTDAELPITVDPVLSAPSVSVGGENIQDHLGSSVAGAGDVNGDGISDVVVGASGFGLSNNEGAVYVFLGIGGVGLVDPDPFLFDRGGGAGRQMGTSVSSAGDVNNDGFSDVVVGGMGRVWVYLGGQFAMSGLAPLLSPTIGSRFGQAVAGAGDVNGDGRSDLLVGAPYYDADDNVGNGIGEEGAVYLLMGGALDANPPPFRVGGNKGDHLGWAVDGAGDLNADSFDDLVVGAPGADAGRGFVYTFTGQAVGAPTPNTILPGAFASTDEFGTSVAGAGDFDGDGFADFAVGAPGAGTLREGVVTVHKGAAGAVGALLVRFESDRANTGLGHAVDGGGDLNGDGLSDVVMGTPHYTKDQSDEGAVFVAFGSRAPGPWPTLSLLEESGRISAMRGHSVAIVGDLDDDGVSEIATGAPGWTDLLAGAGRVHLFRGDEGDSEGVGWAATGRSSAGGMVVGILGDLDGNGYGEFLVGVPECDDGELDEGCLFIFLGDANGMAPAPSWTFDSDQAGALLGAAVTTGDFDGDGDLDFAAGAPGYTDGEPDEGAVFVWENDGWPPSNPTLLEVNQAGSAFGGAVASAGDVDRDGYDDLAVGAPGCDVGGPDRGRVHVYRGGPAGLEAKASFDHTWEQDGAQVGANVEAAGDVNGDGYADLLVSAPFWDGGSTDEGRVGLYKGSSQGLQPVLSWFAEGEGDDRRMGGGWDVSTDSRDGDGLLGRVDMDRDGFSDIFVGTWRFSFPEANEGLVQGWKGSLTGLPGVPTYVSQSNTDQEWRGYALAGGDLNGDGFADLVYGGAGPAGAGWDVNEGYVNFLVNSGTGSGGAGSGTSLAVGDYNGDGCGDLLDAQWTYDDAAPGDGRVYLHAGCASDFRAAAALPRPGPRIAPVARRPSSAIDVSPGLRVATNSFDIGFARARTPVGRQSIFVEAEVKPLNVPFDGKGLHPSAVVDTGLGGVDIDVPIVGLSDDTSFHWRVRVRYDPARAGSEVSSGWYYGGVNGDAAGTHVVTKCGPGDADLDGVLDCADQDDDNDFDLDRDDCNDNDPTIFRFATEICDAIDQDCDGDLLEAFPDADSDGKADCIDDDDDGDGDPDVSDCADLDAAIFGTAPELCDDVDNNCDGAKDEGFPNFDSDPLADCVDPDDDDDGDPDVTDCKDLDHFVSKFGTEACDAVDQDCDGDLVEGFDDTDDDGEPDCIDEDDDGDGDPDASDCADLDKAISKSAFELCDAIDQDCDDDVLEAFLDSDDDKALDCVDPDDDGDDDPDTTDCAPLNPLVHAGAEDLCDLVDADCDGDLTEGCDTGTPDTDTDPIDTDLIDTDDTDTLDTQGLDTAYTWVTGGGGCRCGGGSALSLWWTAPLLLFVRRRRARC